MLLFVVVWSGSLLCAVVWLCCVALMCGFVVWLCCGFVVALLWRCCGVGVALLLPPKEEGRQQIDWPIGCQQLGGSSKTVPVRVLPWSSLAGFSASHF
jgi:hypothetical protein